MGPEAKLSPALGGASKAYHGPIVALCTNHPSSSPNQHLFDPRCLPHLTCRFKLLPNRFGTVFFFRKLNKTIGVGLLAKTGLNRLHGFNLGFDKNRLTSKDFFPNSIGYFPAHAAATLSLSSRSCRVLVMDSRSDSVCAVSCGQKNARKIKTSRIEPKTHDPDSVTFHRNLPGNGTEYLANCNGKRSNMRVKEYVVVGRSSLLVIGQTP